LHVACEVGKPYDHARLRNGMSRRFAWSSCSIPFELHFLALGYQYGTKLCCAYAVDGLLHPILFISHFLKLSDLWGKGKWTLMLISDDSEAFEAPTFAHLVDGGWPSPALRSFHF
jgi:hypothetical protein